MTVNAAFVEFKVKIAGALGVTVNVFEELVLTTTSPKSNAVGDSVKSGMPVPLTATGRLTGVGLPGHMVLTVI